MPRPSDPIETRVAADLFAILDKHRGLATELASNLRTTPQVVGNWKRRGVPFKKIPDVVSAMAGLGHKLNYTIAAVGKPGDKETGMQHTIEAEKVIDDFKHLPDGLQEYIARKAAELRAYSESLPKFLREGLKPPKDAEAYRSWEKEMEADMIRLLALEKVIQFPKKR